MFEIHDEYGKVLSCKTLKSAVCRKEDLARTDLRINWFNISRWLVDTKATESYSSKHPTSRLKGPVFVRCPGGV